VQLSVPTSQLNVPLVARASTLPPRVGSTLTRTWPEPTGTISSTARVRTSIRKSSAAATSRPSTVARAESSTMTGSTRLPRLSIMTSSPMNMRTSLSFGSTVVPSSCTSRPLIR
jgi:hypothetical protein